VRNKLEIEPLELLADLLYSKGTPQAVEESERIRERLDKARAAQDELRLQAVDEARKVLSSSASGKDGEGKKKKKKRKGKKGTKQGEHKEGGGDVATGGGSGDDGTGGGPEDGESVSITAVVLQEDSGEQQEGGKGEEEETDVCSLCLNELEPIDGEGHDEEKEEPSPPLFACSSAVTSIITPVWMSWSSTAYVKVSGCPMPSLSTIASESRDLDFSLASYHIGR